MLITLICRQCNQSYQRKPSRIHLSHFCSAKCRSASLSDKFRTNRVHLVCQQCFKEYSRVQSQTAKSKYCSISCQRTAKAHAANLPELINDGRYVELTCEQCGKTFPQPRSRLKYGRGKHCSPACQYAARRAKPKIGQDCTCLNCSKIFRVAPSKFRGHNGVGKYCSRQCRNIHRILENHPQYLDGRSSVKRGPNWQAQKRKAKNRDAFTCQRCGLTEIDSDMPLQVHHIQPFRTFKSYKTANRLSNLITLCEACHRKADAAYQRHERIGTNYRLPL